MDNYTTEKRGTIYLGDKVMVSDPCYGINTWCQGVIENVLSGEYECKVGFSNEGDCGIRVADIDVTHSDYADKFLAYEAEEFEVGVDSGQAGIYDYEYYKKHHSDANESKHVNDYWYDTVCSKTHEDITNHDYISFVELPEYKATLMVFMQELNELHNRYPYLDTYSYYENQVNHYHSLMDSSNDFRLSELTEILKKLNEVLSNDKQQEKVEKTSAEKELDDINFKYSDILRGLWKAYNKSIHSQKTIYRSTGNTIDGRCFVSSSGYGDGGYTCYTAKENGKVVAIRVEYMTDENYEEDE